MFILSINNMFSMIYLYIITIVIMISIVILVFLSYKITDYCYPVLPVLFIIDYYCDCKY